MISAMLPLFITYCVKNCQLKAGLHQRVWPCQSKREGGWRRTTRGVWEPDAAIERATSGSQTIGSRPLGYMNVNVPVLVRLLLSTTTPFLCL